MLTSPTINCLVDAEDYPVLALQFKNRILGEVWYGSHHPGDVPWPSIHVQHPLLGRAPCVEIWLAEHEVTILREGRLQLAYDRETLFCGAQLDMEKPLDEASHDVYRTLMEQLSSLRVNHVLRAWNIIPHIHAIENGLERYRNHV